MVAAVDIVHPKPASSNYTALSLAVGATDPGGVWQPLGRQGGVGVWPTSSALQLSNGEFALEIQPQRLRTDTLAPQPSY